MSVVQRETVTTGVFSKSQKVFPLAVQWVWDGGTWKPVLFPTMPSPTKCPPPELRGVNWNIAGPEAWDSICSPIPNQILLQTCETAGTWLLCQVYKSFSPGGPLRGIYWAIMPKSNFTKCVLTRWKKGDPKVYPPEEKSHQTSPLNLDSKLCDLRTKPVLSQWKIWNFRKSCNLPLNVPPQSTGWKFEHFRSWSVGFYIFAKVILTSATKLWASRYRSLLLGLRKFFPWRST